MSRTDPDRARRLTVLMPVFNGAAFLSEQIESILQQDYRWLTLIALDDASTDASWTMLNEAAASDARINVVRNDQNRGFVAAIERLLSMVETPYFALADQDDVWDPHKISSLIRLLQTTGAALVYSDERVCDETGHVIHPSYFAYKRLAVLEGRDPVPFIFRNPVVGHTIVATRAVARRAARVPPGLVFHESWLVAVASSQGDIRASRDRLGCFRLHRSNVIGPRRRGRIERLKLTVERGEHLEQRQRTRRAALAAAATVHPEIERLAMLYQREGWRRLVAFPFVARTLLRRCKAIGRRRVWVELLLWLIPLRDGEQVTTASACRDARGQ